MREEAKSKPRQRIVRNFELYSEDENLLCEAFYLLVLSLLGQYCDREGFLRVHALGVATPDKAVLKLTDTQAFDSGVVVHTYQPTN